MDYEFLMKVLVFLGDRTFKFVIHYQYYSNELNLEIRDFYLHFHILSLSATGMFFTNYQKLCSIWLNNTKILNKIQNYGYYIQRANNIHLGTCLINMSNHSFDILVIVPTYL